MVAVSFASSASSVFLSARFGPIRTVEAVDNTDAAFSSFFGSIKKEKEGKKKEEKRAVSERFNSTWCDRTPGELIARDRWRRGAPACPPPSDVSASSSSSKNVCSCGPSSAPLNVSSSCSCGLDPHIPPPDTPSYLPNVVAVEPPFGVSRPIAA